MIAFFSNLRFYKFISLPVCRSASSADVARLESSWTSSGEEARQSGDTHSDEGTASELHGRTDADGPGERIDFQLETFIESFFLHTLYNQGW